MEILIEKTSSDHWCLLFYFAALNKTFSDHWCLFVLLYRTKCFHIFKGKNGINYFSLQTVMLADFSENCLWALSSLNTFLFCQNARRGDPTSTSSDSGYDAQTFLPYHRGDNSSNEEEAMLTSAHKEPVRQSSLSAKLRGLYPRYNELVKNHYCFLK